MDVPQVDEVVVAHLADASHAGARSLADDPVRATGERANGRQGCRDDGPGGVGDRGRRLRRCANRRFALSPSTSAGGLSSAATSAARSFLARHKTSLGRDTKAVTCRSDCSSCDQRSTHGGKLEVNDTTCPWCETDLVLRVVGDEQTCRGMRHDVVLRRRARRRRAVRSRPDGLRRPLRASSRRLSSALRPRRSWSRR